jgi:RHS repeat-associated protein
MAKMHAMNQWGTISVVALGFDSHPHFRRSGSGTNPSGTGRGQKRCQEPFLDLQRLKIFDRRNLTGSPYSGVSDPLATNYWHPDYVDALAMRLYDADTDDVFNENSDGQHYYCQDANFNATSVVNASGTALERYNYTPYGQVSFLNSSFGVISSSAIANNHLYTGRERDPETGLQLNRRRYYASWMGRWNTLDPIKYLGGMNLFADVRSRPTFYTDPLGLVTGSVGFPISIGAGAFCIKVSVAVAIDDNGNVAGVVSGGGGVAVGADVSGGVNASV